MQSGGRSASRFLRCFSGWVIFALMLGFTTDRAIGQGARAAVRGSSGQSLRSNRPSDGGSISSLAAPFGVGAQPGSRANSATRLTGSGAIGIGPEMRRRSRRSGGFARGGMGGLNSSPSPRTSRGGRLLGGGRGSGMSFGMSPLASWGRSRSTRSALSLAYSDWKNQSFLGLSNYRSSRAIRMAVAVRQMNDVNPHVVVRSEAGNDALRSIDVADVENTNKESQVSLRQLVENHLATQYRSSLNKGWTHFKAGRYRKACDTFSSTNRLALDDVNACAEAKWGRVFSAVGSSQFSLAVHELSWFIIPDAMGGTRDSLCLSRITEMRSRYGRVSDFDDHLRLVQLRVEQNPDAAHYVALSAVYLWASEETRDQARFIARGLPGMGEAGRAWSRLLDLMELFDQMGPVSGKGQGEGLMGSVASEIGALP